MSKKSEVPLYLDSATTNFYVGERGLRLAVVNDEDHATIVEFHLTGQQVFDMLSGASVRVKGTVY